jgi:hypothetical protein
MFRLQQGQMANQRAANVGGGALSGNTLRGLQDYTQGQASQGFKMRLINFRNGLDKHLQHLGRHCGSLVKLGKIKSIQRRKTRPMPKPNWVSVLLQRGWSGWNGKCC